MDIDQKKYFNCSQCGSCCQGWKVPLSISEALSWIERGNEIEILTEGSFYIKTDESYDPSIPYKLERMFAASTGKRNFYVRPIVVASFQKRCPNLMSDNRCAIYEQRPLTCRIYPAEINPFIKLNEGHKKCPPASWSKGHEILSSSAGTYRKQYAQLIDVARNTAISDMKYWAHICHTLSIACCALVGEGYAVYKVTYGKFYHAVKMALDSIDNGPVVFNDKYVVLSNRKKTVDALAAHGAAHALIHRENYVMHAGDRVTYYGFHEDSFENGG